MNDYRALLDSTAEHLQNLKNRGALHLPVRSETLAALAQPLTMRRAALAVEPTIAAPGPTAILPAPTKAQAMGELHDRAKACVKCPHLVRSRQNVVFGVGDIDSPLMFVGEAPGADEDAKGEPFVGAAGELLTRIIKTMGFNRSSVYIANILKCRPDTPGQTSGNRKPTPDEMKTCLPYLLAQIEVIRPKVLVALGATAIEGLLGKTEPVGKLRGKFLQFRDIPLMPTFHPAYLVRNQALSEKRKVWEDMLQVMELLGAPISEKQRGYFLPAPIRSEMAATT
jgi:DNA polymerase